MLKRYPYDPTGRSTDNLVSTERHVLSGNGGDILFPRYGAFFNDSLVVKQGEKKLIFNQDYQLSFFWQDATVKVGAPISMAFQILNDRLIGEIQIDYQVVGGEYQGTIEAIEQLKKTLPKMHRNVFWDDVINKPEAWVPTRHLHNIDDIFGLTPLALALEELRRSLEHQSVLKLKTVYDRFLKLKQYVEANLTNNGIQAEVNRILGLVDEKLQSVMRKTDVDLLIAKAKKEVKAEVDQKYNDRVEELERGYLVAQSEWSRLGGLATQARTDIDDLTSSLHEAETKIRELDSKIGRDVAAVDTKLTNLKNEVNSKLNEHTVAIDGLRTNISTGIEAAKTDLQSRIAQAIADERTAMDAKLTQLKAETGTISSNDITKLIAKIDKEIKDRTAGDLASNNNLEQYKTFANSKRNELATQITGLDQKHNQLKQRVDDLETRGNASNQTHTTNFNNISGRVDAINTRLTEVEKKVKQPAAAPAAAVDTSNFVTNTQFNFFKNQYRKKLTELDDNYADFKKWLPAIQTQIQNNQGTSSSSNNQRIEDYIRRVEEIALQSSAKDDEHDRLIKDLLKRMYIMDGGNNPTSDSVREDFYRAMEQSVNETIERHRREFERTTNKLQADLNKKSSVDPDELNRTIKKILDQKIAEERIASPEFNLTRLNITPDAPTEQTISGGKYITSNIIYMADNVDKTKVIPFAPTTSFEWTASSSWVIPDKYNDMIAQVHLTTPLKWQQQPTRFEPNGTALTPSTKVAYIRLKSGIPIDLTIGDVVSFGTIFSNDGVSDHRMVTPGILMNSNAIPTNTIGSYGKITVIV